MFDVLHVFEYAEQRIVVFPSYGVRQRGNLGRNVRVAAELRKLGTHRFSVKIIFRPNAFDRFAPDACRVQWLVSVKI